MRRSWALFAIGLALMVISTGSTMLFPLTLAGGIMVGWNLGNILSRRGR